MGIIHILPDHVANQIAAGEVIERPASVVKELVENAIDAGATRLRIVIDQGGRDILVSDDGSGMSAEDAKLAFARFATSKLQSADDLWDLRTLGFRGEALASIASIAEVICTTRQADAPMATRLHWRASELLDEGETGGAVGTTFQIKDLFFNTPARLRFMRSPSAEMAAISELVGALALAYPHVSFVLNNGAREVLRTPGDGDATLAVRSVLGRDIGDHLFAVSADDGRTTITGVATRASYHRADRYKQFIFVNGRWVKLPFVTKLLDEFYADLIPSRRYPSVVLSLQVDPATLDVNVHPTKREVRLREAPIVRNLLAQALGGAIALQAGHRTSDTVERLPNAAPDDAPVQGRLPYSGRQLGKNSAMPARAPRAPWEASQVPDEISGSPADPAPSATPKRTAEPAAETTAPAVGKSRPTPVDRPSAAQTQAALALYKPLAPKADDAGAEDGHDHDAPEGMADHDHGPMPGEAVVPMASQQGQRFADLTALGQMYRTYIVAAGSEGLFLIDQHTAHERVLFEKLSRESTVQSQMLLVPLAVDADAGVIDLVAAHRDLLAAFGFEFDGLGGTGLVITAVPQLLSLSQAELAWQDLVEDLQSFDGIAGRGARLAAIRKTVACKAAVKAGDTLHLPQMQELLKQLVNVDQPYTCPHGRPVVSVLPKDELDRRFDRTWSIKGE
jgi:DNA mismatch repair protein MutL